MDLNKHIDDIENELSLNSPQFTYPKYVQNYSPGQLAKPLHDKSFFFHIKSSTFQQKEVIEEIIVLGGKVENFIHKDVSYVVVDDPKMAAAAKMVESSDSGFKTASPSSLWSRSSKSPMTFSPLSNSSSLELNRSLPLSRGHALLLKSIENKISYKSYCTCTLTCPHRCHQSKTGGTTNVLEVCRNWHIKVLALENLVAWLDKMKKIKILKATKKDADKKYKIDSPGSSLQTPKRLKGTYIKMEDHRKMYATSYKAMDTWPDICQPLTGFSEASSQNKKFIRTVKEVANQQQLALNGTKKKKKLSYCEICQVYYRNLKQHVLSRSHITFMEKNENFSQVEQAMQGFYHLPAFLNLCQSASSLHLDKENNSSWPGPQQEDDNTPLDLSTKSNQVDLSTEF